MSNIIKIFLTVISFSILSWGGDMNEISENSSESQDDSNPFDYIPRIIEECIKDCQTPQSAIDEMNQNFSTCVKISDIKGLSGCNTMESARKIIVGYFTMLRIKTLLNMIRE